MKNRFNGPIPGESLTGPVGGTPWEQPPQYAKVEDALKFYMTRLENDGVLEDALFLIDNDLPIELFVNNLLLYGEMKGKHTADTSLIIGPVIHEYLKAICDVSGIKYREFQGKTKEDKIKDKKKKDVKILLGKTLSTKGKDGIPALPTGEMNVGI